MPTIPASGADDLPTDVIGTTIWDETVEPGEYAAHHLPRGAHLRLTDLDGDACAHMIVHNTHQPAERLNPADTVKVQWQAYPTTGSRLLSDMGRALLTIVSDTAGRHDALCGAPNRTDHDTNGNGSVIGPAPNARDQLVVAALKAGLERKDVGPSIAFFKGARVAPDGALEFTPDANPPGAAVTLRCELDVHIALANAPHVLDSRAGAPSTALRITAWQPDSAGSDGSASPDATREMTPETTLEMTRAELNNDDWIGGRG